MNKLLNKLFVIASIAMTTSVIAQPAYIYYDDGIKKLDARDYIAATISFSTAITKDKNNYKAYTERGHAYLLQNKPIDALKDFEQAIKLKSDYAPTYLYRGDYYFKLKKYKEAIDDYNKATKYDATLPEPFANKGFSYYELKQDVDAIKSFDEAIRLSSKNLDMYVKQTELLCKAKRCNDATVSIDKGLSLNDVQPMLHYYNAQCMFDEQKYIEALAEVTKSIEQKKVDASTVTLRATCYEKLNMPEKALDDYNYMITTLKTNTAEVFMKRGIALKLKKDYANANKDFSKALIKDFGNAKLYELRAHTWLMQGKKPQALVDYNKAIELDANNEPALFNRGTILFEQNKFEKAIEDFTAAIRVKPTADGYYNRSKCYYKLNKKNESCADLQKAADLGDKQAAKDKMSFCK
jgi:tetratricopeptide (TPR) repeat protein